MPDQSSAADEHAILQEITAPLDSLPDNPVPIAAEVDFPIVLRGYDRIAVDAYVKRTSQLVAELQATHSPEAAVRRALERVGEQISGILQRAHDTAEEITAQSRREAEDRLEVARQEAARIAADGIQRVKDLDADTDRIWAERMRIVEDARELAAQLTALAEEAAARFPEAEEAVPAPSVQAGPFDVEAPQDEGAPDAEYVDDPDATAVLPEPSEDATAVLPEPSEDATAVLPEPPDSEDATAVLPEPPDSEDATAVLPQPEDETVVIPPVAPVQAPQPPEPEHRDEHFRDEHHHEG